MATVSWNPFGVSMNITATGSNITRISATTFTVKIDASWKVSYSGNLTNYGMKATSGGQTYIISKFDGNTTFSSGSGSFTGTYSISGNGSQSKTITVTFENYKTSPVSSATKNVTFDVNVPAWTSYVISYSANGGSGAPLSQTKWKDQALTLSSTKPTRTGYTFLGWGTSTSDTTVDYSAGGTVTASTNKDLNLYAIWSEHKLTVNFYSNYATESFDGALNIVGSNKNVIVRTVEYLYDNEYPNGLWDYSQSGSSTYLGRIGYTATGYWGTSTTGGTLISQSTSYATGQALAKAVGKSLESGNASINMYPQWKINTYTIFYNPNGGSGTVGSQTIEWQETFAFTQNTFTREGYKFIGWNLYRNDDDKWYAESQGWTSEGDIVANGYTKRLYEDQRELTLDDSWIKGNEFETTKFTLYAIWEISGVVYIDNGIVLEPYLAYIDDGTNWNLYLAYVDNGVNWNIIS